MTELNLAQAIITGAWLYEVDENLYDYIVTEKQIESLTSHPLFSIEQNLAKIHQLLQDDSKKGCFVLSALTYQMAKDFFGNNFDYQTIVDIGVGFTSTKFKLNTEQQTHFPFFEPTDAIDFYQTLHTGTKKYFRIYDAIYTDDLDLVFEKSQKRIHIDQLMTGDQCLIVCSGVWFPFLVKTAEILVEKGIGGLFGIYRYSDFFDNKLIAAATQCDRKLLVICDYQSSDYQQFLKQTALSAGISIDFIVPADMNQSLIESEYGESRGPEFRSDLIGQKVALMYN